MTPSLSHSVPTSENHLLKMLSRGAPVSEVLNEICNFIGAKSPGVIPAVLLLDGDGNQLRLAAGPKVPAVWSAAFAGLQTPTHPTLLGTNGTRQTVFRVIDLRNNPWFAACWDLANGQGVQAAWSLPILSKDDKVLGTMILFCPTLHPPDTRELALLEQAIHVAAIAIDYHRKEEELRDFSRRLYLSQDEERRRIARELHDSTGQKLSYLIMTLARLRATVPDPSIEFAANFTECTSVASNISDELRTLSYLLHPPMLDECGLSMAIQWYVSGINERHGLHVDVEILEEPGRLSSEAELAIFRIVQASLSNVHLHSQSDQAKVKLEENADGMLVEISDEGRGMPEGVLDHSSRTNNLGIGITGMRERIQQLGGKFEIASGHSGTIVRASIPRRHFRMVAAATAGSDLLAASSTAN